MAAIAPAPIAVGVITTEHLHEEAARQQAGRLRTIYEHHEFEVPAAASFAAGDNINDIVDHSTGDPTTGCSCGRTSTGGSVAAFGLIPRSQRVVIRNVGVGQIQVRFNGRTSGVHDTVSVDVGEYLDWNMVETTDIFFSNPGAAEVLIRVALG
jgi:hypothetical protein